MIVSRKIPRPLEAAQARQLIEDYRHWKCVVNDADAVLGAIGLAGRYQISFWDGLIVHAANEGRAGLLYTEELNSGQRYESVLAKNPFAS